MNIHFNCFKTKYLILRVPEYQKINDIVRNYFTAEFHDDEVKEKIQFYVSAGIKEVTFLMKSSYGKFVYICFTLHFY